MLISVRFFLILIVIRLVWHSFKQISMAEFERVYQMPPCLITKSDGGRSTIRAPCADRTDAEGAAGRMRAAGDCVPGGNVMCGSLQPGKAVLQLLFTPLSD